MGLVKAHSMGIHAVTLVSVNYPDRYGIGISKASGDFNIHYGEYMEEWGGNPNGSGTFGAEARELREFAHNILKLIGDE